MLNLKTVFLLFLASLSYAQSDTKYFDLIHSEIHLKPDFKTNTINGKVHLKLIAHFYDQKELSLDAKGMKINQIKIDDKSISSFIYDGQKINIVLPKIYTATDTVFLKIEYIAQPNTIKIKGSDAILADKGFYFIDSLSHNNSFKDQFWTQGETQANSCWFPTLDSPHQKHTQDVYLTVKQGFTTLSNGKLIKQTPNNDGTRTDHWKMSQPHAVYLSMVAAGDYTKIVDSTFKRFEVSYYLEPKYAPLAYGIFGRTPEMINFFEKILGVPYAWNKYSQIPVRHYVSGAMENTTATIHGSNLNKNFNQLIDGNDDGVIAHELFHHWFGNLVTCESWSHLPLNESFANYSEFLWAQEKYGKDEADHVYVTALLDYFNESNQKKESLIRYNLTDREAMFDAHSYQKGGRVLHTLRLEIGDAAFFKGLNVYLKKYAFSHAEIDQLRQAFEEVTGRDLKWFFDQWFLRPGHPAVQVRTKKGVNNTLILYTNQILDSTQTTPYINLSVPYTLNSGQIATSGILKVQNLTDTFTIKTSGPNDVLVLNPDGYFLGNIIEDELKKDDLLQIGKIANTYYTKLYTLERLFGTAENAIADREIRKLTQSALKDKHWRIRQWAVQKFFNYDGDDFLEIEKSIQQIIKNDPNSNVRAEGIIALKNYLNPQNNLLFREALKDTSYLVRAQALEALYTNEAEDAPALVDRFKDYDDVNIFSAVGNYFANSSDFSLFPWYVSKLSKFEGFEKYRVFAILGTYLSLLKPEEIEQTLPYLEKVATQDQVWYVRMAAIQTLNNLKSNSDKIQPIIDKIKKTETNPSLLENLKKLE